MRWIEKFAGASIANSARRRTAEQRVTDVSRLRFYRCTITVQQLLQRWWRGWVVVRSG
jgi:hypothetical protein